MTKRTKGTLIKYSALGLDVGAPLFVTFTQFPAMIERGSTSTVSGLFVIFALLSAIPIIKHFGKMFKTPSVPVVWVICFAGLLALRSIIDEMILICGAGAISNVIGAALYKYGDHLSEEKKE